MSYPKLKAFKISGVEYKRTQVGRLSSGDKLGGAVSAHDWPDVIGGGQLLPRHHFAEVRAENNRRRNLETARQYLDRINTTEGQLMAAAPIPPVWYTEEHAHAETNPTAPRTQGIYGQLTDPYLRTTYSTPEYDAAMERLMWQNPTFVPFIETAQPAPEQFQNLYSAQWIRAEQGPGPQPPSEEVPSLDAPYGTLTEPPL